VLHPAAYVEFRTWHRQLLGRQPSTAALLWHWLRQAIGRRPAVAPVNVAGLRHPVYLRPWSSDLYVFEQLFVDREYDTPLATPTTVLDAGANIGLASVYFANRFPDARIVAVEPESNNFEMLRMNTKRYPNIRCVRAAVWSRPGMLRLENRDDKSWAFRFTESPATLGDQTSSATDVDATDETVEAIDIDGLAERWNQGRAFDLLKIDIEGAEKDVFAAGGDWLERSRAVVVECHDRLAEGAEKVVVDAMNCRPYSSRRSGEYLVFERHDDGLAGDGG
jgi:FkbM family methyltransferase